MTTVDKIPMSQFVAETKITLTVEKTSFNPNMDNSLKMDHWKVQLKRGPKRMTIVFSKGFGHNGEPPTIEEVLDCLASDSASIVDSPNFEEWAEDFGYDPDSRQAERTYSAVRAQASRLLVFLGENYYDDLLWNTERD